MTKSFSQQNIKICFTGDVAFSGYFAGHEYDDLLDSTIKSFLKETAAVVINLENPITTSNYTDKERLAHKSSKKSLDFLKENFRRPVAVIANNHMMDYGESGLLDTLANLEEAEIEKTGAGNNLEEAIKPVIIDQNGISVGIIAVQYKKHMIAGKATCGPVHDSYSRHIKKAISCLKKKVDWVVMIYHGGEEFLHTPMPYARRKLKSYIKWGADVVVAHHPHTVQGFEMYKDKYIFYSLGNFIFDTDYQRLHKDTENGVVINIIFGKDKIEFEQLPIQINRDNLKIVSRNNDIYFADINTIDYAAFWHKEAFRKQEVLKITNESIEKESGRASIKKKSSLSDRLKEVLSDPKDAVRKAEKKLTLKKGRKAYRKENN